MYLSACLSVYLSIFLSVCLSVYLPVYLQACKRSYSARRPQFLNLTTSKTQQFCETSSMFEVDNAKNEAILRDILNFWTWQRQKRSNSATLLIFRSRQHQKRSNSARRPSKMIKMESWVQSWRPRTNMFRHFFQSTCLNYCACHEKVMPGHTAASVTQNHLSKPQNRMLQNATPLRKSAPGPPNSSDEDVSCTAPATEKAS